MDRTKQYQLQRGYALRPVDIQPKRMTSQHAT